MASPVAQQLRICLQCRHHRRRGFNPWVRKIHLEEGMETHSSILTWRIPQTEETGRLQSIGLQRVRHNWSNLACMHISCAAATAAKSLQSCPTLCDPIDGSPPGSSVHGIFQARVLMWVAIAFSVTKSYRVDIVHMFTDKEGEAGRL